jgi:CO dehydrogenase maturation factor
VAKHAAQLARQLGIGRIHLVVNRYRDEASDKLQRFAEATDTDTARLFDVIHTLPCEARFEELEPDVTRILGMDSAYVAGLNAVADDMLAFDRQRQGLSAAILAKEETRG